MSDPKQADSTKDNAAASPTSAGGQDNRSDNLLPGDGGAEDGRFDVAEEVSLDQNSDEARRIGQAPADGIADSLPEALKTPVASQPVPDKS